MQTFKKNVFDQVKLFPNTRYMGSKEKLLVSLFDVFNSIEFKSAIDLMSGTNSVSYLLKAMNKKVYTNDYMNMNYTIAKALIVNNQEKLNSDEAQKLLIDNNSCDFVYNTFKDIYYSCEDLAMIDNIKNNIKSIQNSTLKSLCMSALIRACLKKRPRGIFAYTGNRYDDGRKDLKFSINEHFLFSLDILNKAVFSNHEQNKSFKNNCLELKCDADLVYIDPPYFSPLSDNEYVRRYHFVEGLSKYWNGLEIQENTKTKKFKNYPTPFSKLNDTKDAFERLLYKYRNKHIVISYSSNALPDKNFFIDLLKKFKKTVYFKEIDYRYSFSNQGHAMKSIRNKVNEYIFVGTDK